MGIVVAIICLAAIIVVATSRSVRTKNREMRSAARSPTAPRKPEVLPNLTGDDCWTPPGNEISSDLWTLPGGMIYVGHGLQAGAPGYRCTIEPALLDPSLPVDAPGSGRYADLPYWPQYAELSPRARSAVLDWLAGGRSDPKVDLGVVFIFFYGLERRLIVDGIRDRSEKVRDEAPALIAEIERLQTIYRGNRSFQTYSTQLLTFAQTVYLGRVTATVDPNPNHRDPDPAVRIILGQLSLNGEPIPSALALHWYITSEEQRLRTPAKRCWSQFEELFERRYRDKFGDGMIVKPNKTKLRLDYTPASPGLTAAAGRLTIPVENLPDIMRLKKPLKQIAPIAEECQNDLEPYSRWLGKNPDAGDTLEATALLPPELATQAETTEVKELRRELEYRLKGSDMVASRRAFLFDYWNTSKPDKMRKREAVALAQLLERLGYGMEPDPRFGGPPLSRDAPVVLFRQDPIEIVSTPSDEYASAMLVLQLAALVAAADGTVDKSEEGTLARHLEQSLDLSPGERLRLSAHLRWLTASGPRFTGLKKRLAQLDTATRQEIAEFAVAMANADGHIDPEEIKVLRRLYSMLQLDRDDVYNHVHGATVSAPARGPVQVRPATPGSNTHKIPPPAAAAEPNPQAGAAVDMERVRQKLQETAHVSAMLSDIFAEDDEEQPSQASAADGQDSGGLDGLDAAQMSFFRSLMTKAEWSQDELEDLAAQHEVMLDGTVDAINEHAFEEIDQAVIDWDDPIKVDLEAAKELWA